MTTLRTAAQQALEAMEGGADSWQLVGPAIDALKAALVEDAMQKFTDVNQELQAALGCDHCNSPLYAAVKCRVCGRVTKPAPPQRKPLTEWQINDLMANIDPEDVDSWSFRQGVYATEKHHGVRP